MSPRRADNRYFAHLAYTSLFEKTVATAVSASAVYGAITVVRGAAGSVTVNAPQLTADVLHTKAAFHYAVINEDGAGTVILATPDGKTINGSSTITLPAAAGASAFVFLDLTNGEWIAFLSGPSAPLPAPPAYTAQGGGQNLTQTPTAVAGASITTAPFTASQKAIITYATQFNSAAGLADDVTISIFDGVASSPMHTWQQTCGDTARDTTPWFNTVSVTMEVLGNGSARTFGLAVSQTNAGTLVSIPVVGSVGVVQIVNG